MTGAEGKVAELRIQVGPVRTQVRRSGRGEPLVYLHGLFCWQGWPPFLQALSRRFTVYAPVMPGFGESEGIEALDDVLDLALYHLDLLEALGLTSAHVVGHFLGAMAAAEMTALCPHKTRRLVLAAPAGLWSDEDPGEDLFATPHQRLAELLLTRPESELARRLFPDPSDDEEEARLAQAERVRNMSAVARFLWPIPDKGLAKRLPRITTPALVMVGGKDRVVPPSLGREAAGRMPHARLEVLEGAGHLFHLEDPGGFARTVSSFLAG